jgi:hypothetical protein
MSGETLKIAGTDLSTTAYITSWEGILASPPYRGDLIELDFVAGGVWEPGEVGVWTIDVPLVMKSQDVGTAVGHMRTIQGYADGTEKRVTRIFTSGTSTVTESADGVVTSATPVWDLRFRQRVGLLLTIQITSGPWVTGT